MSLAELLEHNRPSTSERAIKRQRRKKKNGINKKFSNTVKGEALAKAKHRCNRCGKKRGLEIHHRVPTWFFLEYVPHGYLYLMNELCNAEVLCHSCHTQEHKNNREEDENAVEYYALLAQVLLGIDF